MSVLAATLATITATTTQEGSDVVSSAYTLAAVGGPLRGAAVLRITAQQLGARTVDDLALQADGTVAFTYGNGRLGIASAAVPGVRVLARRAAFRGLGLAAGRVLYGRVLDADPYRVDLMVRPVAGGAARRLARFNDRRAQIGDVDLDATRATWAWQPKRRGYEGTPTGPVRIVVRGL